MINRNFFITLVRKPQTLVCGSFIFLILLITLILLSFWRVLWFDFWRDDWGFLWTALYDPWEISGLLTIHPATWVEDLVLIRIFGWNPIYWNIFGLVLRVLTALSFGLMMLEITRSRKVAILSSIFLASSYIGLETVGWSSIHVVPIVTIFICIGFYFWFKYKQVLNLFLAIIFFNLAFLGDPGRVFPFVLLILIWEVFDFFLKKDKKQLLNNIFIILFLSNLFLGFYFFLSTHFGVRANLTVNIQSLYQDLSTIKYFFNSLGNLMFGAVIQINEFGGTSEYSFLMAVAGALIIISIILLSLTLGIVKKSEEFLRLAWFALWIPIFYFPNWLFNPTYVSGSTHRYLALSGIGFIAIIIICLTYIKDKKILIILSSIWIVLNIITCNRILKIESSHRSKEAVNRLWDKVVNDVPSATRKDIFLFSGDSQQIQSMVVWSAIPPWPYIVKTGSRNGFPHVVLSYEQARDILCTNVGWSRLSNLYSWKIGKNIIVNTTVEDREALKKMASSRDCLLQ